MVEAQIIHNPNAGDEEHGKNQLITLVENAGYKVSYISTDDENWEASLIENPEIIYVAGGDGTVRKIAGALLKNTSSIERNTPIQVLPLGTANNIAKTLNISNEDIPEIIANKLKLHNFDCGKVTGLEGYSFFIESFGLGIFPELILKMKNDEKDRNASEKLKHTYTVLKQLIDSFKPIETSLDIQGKTIKDSFLMVEVMNIKSLGPNLELAPNANPGDSFFDLVLIREKSRKALARYVDSLINGSTTPHELKEFSETLRVKNVSFHNVSSNLHIDDKLFQHYSGKKIIVENNSGAFKMRYNS